MTDSNRPVARSSHPQNLLCALAVTLAVGCSPFAPHVRNSTSDPDTRLSAALVDLERARGLGPDNLALPEQERVFLDSGRIRNEIARLALEFPSHVPTLYANALLAYEAGELVLSEQYLERVLSLDARHGDAAALRGRILLEAGNLDLAIARLERDCEWIPDHAGLRENHAAALAMAGDLEGALRELGIADRLGADRSRVLYHRGWIAERTGDSEQAIALYREALAIDPSFTLPAARLKGLEATPR